MSQNTIMKPDLIVALDIGTTKVCAIAGRKNEHGKLEVLGIGKVKSEGVIRGVVANIEKMVNAITEAIAIAEKSLDEPIKDVFVGIAGQHIKSLQHRGMLTRNSQETEISEGDLGKLINDMHKLVLPPGDKILHILPQEFTIDGEQGITDPIGMSGIRLEANFHIITGQISASKNIDRCVSRCGLNVASMTLEPIASAQSVLSDEEKYAGVALVDIGGGTTDITIFADGIIRHTAVVPFGGNIITNDIQEGCKIMEGQAEKLKVKFGSALADEVFENRIITIPGLKGHQPTEISEKNLARIIQARMEEIMDIVYYEIRKSGLERKLIGGIVLTGGGALLAHIDKLCAYQTGLTTRIGFPIEQLAHGYHERLGSPIYSTSIGLLLNGIEAVELGQIVLEKVKESETEDEMTEHIVEESDENGKWYNKIFQKTKDWFEEEPDTHF